MNKVIVALADAIGHLSEAPKRQPENVFTISAREDSFESLYIKDASEKEYRHPAFVVPRSKRKKPTKKTPKKNYRKTRFKK